MAEQLLRCFSRERAGKLTSRVLDDAVHGRCLPVTKSLKSELTCTSEPGLAETVLQESAE